MGILEKFRLDCKTALVTGSSRGIGKAMAVALAEAGADIICVSSSLEEHGSVVEQAVLATGRKFTGYSCDFRDRNALYGFIDRVKSKNHQIDILVNNAGTVRRAPAVDHRDEIWDEVIDINLNAPFVLSREFGKEMVKRGSGKIIFTASVLTFQGGLNVPGYTASKGAIGQLTMALSNEWASKGVNVNAIAPGYIRTDVTQDLQDDPERQKAILGRIPANRWGEVEDIAGTVVFLASSASDYLNGSIVTVDGGWMGR
ncbi:SDR family oxidoreductase [Sneathiella litorea]|uniref:SDR family oxidoreductase n=1 Tax=Sneathiella litorea TaxID=2606216 RepID=A0A6L8W8X4_9PROT|nr:SDR family oxidoreductase [Sneathiella litorea]MZR31581.1 SDR family oxidoreductase [Sneathiella litorea]